MLFCGIDSYMYSSITKSKSEQKLISHKWKVEEWLPVAGGGGGGNRAKRDRERLIDGCKVTVKEKE
jgi:hypothetical protein